MYICRISVIHILINLTVTIMNTKILTRKKGSGHYQITVMEDLNELGTFETNDMQLVDDISEMKNDGFEHELSMHQTFDQVIETCKKRLTAQHYF